MNQTSGDSEAYIVCMSTKKENERGLAVIANGEKEANFLGLEIALEDGTMNKNNELITADARKIKFPPKTFNAIANARKDRKTVKALKRNNDLEK